MQVKSASQVGEAGFERTLSHPGTVYKVHKLINDKCLIADDIFHQIPNGNHPYYFSLFDDGEMAHGLFGHDGRAGFHGLIRSRKKDVRFHNVADESSEAMPWHSTPRSGHSGVP